MGRFVSWPAWLPRPVRLGGGWGLVREVMSPDGERVRVLQVGGVYQSATYVGERRMEPVFSYYRAFDLAFGVRPDTRRVLMVGGGGYAWPKHVLSEGPADAALDVVELDPAVTRAARRWFYLDEACERFPGRLRLIEGDGRAFMERRATELSEVPVGEGACREEAYAYDAIVLDAFAGAEPVRALATRQAALAAKGCLVPDGLVLMNVVSGDGGADIGFLRNVAATFGSVFCRVHVALADDDPLAAEDNYLLIATDGSWDVPGALPFDDAFLGEVLKD